MYNFHTTTTATKLARKLCAAAAITVAAMAFILAGTAHAEPKGGGGTAKGCLIENDGKLETVAVGSKIGLFTCGSDGEWHFGWLITEISSPPKKTVKAVGVTVVRRGSLQAAQASR
jgi:hypothetical protein